MTKLKKAKFNSKEKFSTTCPPIKPKWYLMPVEWVGTLLFCGANRTKVRKHNMKGLKPPYIVLSNHASFIDFPVAVKATFPHRSGWVISIEEFAGKEWLIRSINGIYKRKFTNDLKVVKYMLMTLKRGINVVFYPEARYSLIGKNEYLDKALGKFIKHANVPVVLILEKGNFLKQPQWKKHPQRKVRVEADATLLLTKEDVSNLSADEIQQKIEENFVYDDYKWQLENKIKINSSIRAENIHKVLYKCPHCLQEFKTNSKGINIWCENCNAQWEMNEYGQLHCLNKEEKFTHAPDWYDWQRKEVIEEVEKGEYYFEDEARLEILKSSKEKFVPLGNVKLVHNENGFTMTGILDNGEEFKFNRSIQSMHSVHIEYNFKKRGDAIDLATQDDTYFVFPLTKPNPLTKIHFAQEAMYAKLNRKNQIEKKEEI